MRVRQPHAEIRRPERFPFRRRGPVLGADPASAVAVAPAPQVPHRRDTASERQLGVSDAALATAVQVTCASPALQVVATGSRKGAHVQAVTAVRETCVFLTSLEGGPLTGHLAA